MIYQARQDRYHGECVCACGRLCKVCGIVHRQLTTRKNPKKKIFFPTEMKSKCFFFLFFPRFAPSPSILLDPKPVPS